VWEQTGFLRPENIVVSDDDEVYVLDGGHALIKVLDGNGKLLRQFGSEGTDPGQFPVSARGLPWRTACISLLAIAATAGCRPFC